MRNKKLLRLASYLSLFFGSVGFFMELNALEKTIIGQMRVGDFYPMMFAVFLFIFGIQLFNRAKEE